MYNSYEMKQHFTKNNKNKNNPNMHNGLPYYKRVKWKAEEYLYHLFLWIYIIAQLLSFPALVSGEDTREGILPPDGGNVTCHPPCLTTQFCDTSNNNVIANITDTQNNVTSAALGICKPCSNICLNDSDTQNTQDLSDLCSKVCPGMYV